MIDPKTDPSRRCMPFEEWPEQDRSAFEAATRSGDLLDEAGPAAHWRPATRSKVMSSYGRFLTHLVRQGRLDRSAGPSERLDPDILKAYIAELRAQVSPVTLAQRITDLHEALRVMVPGMELNYLRRVYRRLAGRAVPSRDPRRLGGRGAPGALGSRQAQARAAQGTQAPRRQAARPSWGRE